MALKQDIGVACNGCKSCGGFKIHGWRRFCVDCGCGVERHDISDSESAVSILDEMKLTEKAYYGSYRESLGLAARVRKSWLPVGLKADEIDEFVSLLPNMCDKGSEERCRKRKLRLQIPVTDRCVEKFCHLDTPAERQEAEKFLLNRNNRDIGLGYVVRVTDDKCICADCQISLRPNTLSVSVDNVSGSKQFWHPYCFKCSTCQELLVDFIYVSHNHKIYCIRHYATNTKNRCEACDEIIFAHEYVRTNDETFHSNHFACSICDTTLVKQNYLNHNNSFICKNCYEIKFASKCQKCHQVISCDCKKFSYKDSHWHEECFVCSECCGSLVEKAFSLESDNLYCEGCHFEKLLPRCDVCQQPIEEGLKGLKGDKTVHPGCVLCDECKSPVKEGTVVNNENKYVCMDCFDRKYASKCVKCDEIVRGGVTYRSMKYHHDCFKCHNCSCNLVNVGYFSRNNVIFCKGCYDLLFGITCTKCSDLITAESASRYVKFEDKSWHTGCFNCHKCECSVVEKGFIIKDSNIYCTQC